MLKKLILGLIICSIFFLLVDIGLRGYLFVKYKDKQWLEFKADLRVPPKEIRIGSAMVNYSGYYKLTPGKFEFFYDVIYPYTINVKGYRNDEFLKDKPKNIVRICTFGGSTTFGAEVKDNQTYPYYLQEKLNSYGSRRFEVINCGFPSYKMENIYNLLSKEVVFLKPDIIVIYEAYNDAFQPAIVYSKSLLMKLHDFLYYRWILYTLFLEKYSSLKYKNPLPLFYRQKNLSKDYVNYLKQIIYFAKKNNIEVVLVKQPTIIPEDDLKTNYSLLELENMYITTSDTLKRGIIAQHYYLGQLELLGKENNLLFIDPTQVIMENLGFFTDVLHLNAEGNNVLAGFIAESIFHNEKSLFN